MNKIWLTDPAASNFPAAQDYLELLFEPAVAKEFVDKLLAAPTICKKAKDIFRASSLQLLPKDNRHVKSNLKKFKKGDLLSPILLVRHATKLVIADGYHRLCASYYLSEDLEVPCRLV